MHRAIVARFTFRHTFTGGLASCAVSKGLPNGLAALPGVPTCLFAQPAPPLVLAPEQLAKFSRLGRLHRHRRTVVRMYKGQTEGCQVEAAAHVLAAMLLVAQDRAAEGLSAVAAQLVCSAGQRA